MMKQKETAVKRLTSGIETLFRKYKVHANIHIGDMFFFFFFSFSYCWCKLLYFTILSARCDLLRRSILLLLLCLHMHVVPSGWHRHRNSNSNWMKIEDGRALMSQVNWEKGLGTVTGPNEVTVTSESGAKTKIPTKNIVIATGSDVATLPGINVRPSHARTL